MTSPNEAERKRLRAHRLAERIVDTQARATKTDYDPLAATCLGELIYKEMSRA